MVAASLRSCVVLLLLTTLHREYLQVKALVSPDVRVQQGTCTPSTNNLGTRSPEPGKNTHLTPLRSTAPAAAQSTLEAVSPSSATPSTKSIKTSDVALHIGNIDWNIPSQHVLSQLTNFTSDLPVQRIEIKATTGKRRDVGKCHGGSARILFESCDHAQVAMDRLNSFTVQTATGKEDRFNIGNIKVRWATNLSKNNEQPSSASSEELSQELILHRQRRAEKYQRQRRKIAQKTDDAISSLSQFLPNETSTLITPSLNWSKNDGEDGEDVGGIPAIIDPCRGGGLRSGTERGRRKQAQVEAFLHVLKAALLDNHDSTSSKRTFVADLGSGAGNLSLPLAWFLKGVNAKVFAVDINSKALDRLKSRAEEIGVEVETMVEDLYELTKYKGNKVDAGRDDNGDGNPLGKCSAVVSLHACGAASDFAIEAAVRHSLPFVVSPCCIGKVKAKRTHSSVNSLPSLSSTQRSGAPEETSYPRSRMLQETYNVQEEEYTLILSAADYSVGDLSNRATEQETNHERRGRMAKIIVEKDRLAWAEERGYHVRMMDIPRLGMFYPKRQMLIGAKKGSLAASRISQLSSSSTKLCAKNSDSDDVGVSDSVASEGGELKDRMDLGGFAGYLAPYAAAFILSLAVTGAFVKFILMN